MSEKSIKFTLRNLLPAIAVLWTIFSLTTMYLYSNNIMGVTPFHLPVFLIFISVIGALVCLILAVLKRHNTVPLLISCAIFTVDTIWHVKSFFELLYVA